ncbi:hypothetical protein FRX31_011641 [Thalictrum thalictroides]|uniref:Uncharacterized protein n=1 Tax=Thalictrum thalictroides TaxID=46969 RepID=A0A7J6WN12_THATH|nr:hypothetical protein FRX31_011641 [Thalictrum thalictroides]
MTIAYIPTNIRFHFDYCSSKRFPNPRRRIDVDVIKPSISVTKILSFKDGGAKIVRVSHESPSYSSQKRIILLIKIFDSNSTQFLGKTYMFPIDEVHRSFVVVFGSPPKILLQFVQLFIYEFWDFKTGHMIGRNG